MFGDRLSEGGEKLYKEVHNILHFVRLVKGDNR